MSAKSVQIRWAFDLAAWKPSINELITATTLIQPEEKQRLAKFIFRDDFEASLIGRLMLRKFVKDTTDLPYNKIIFDRDEKGKPYLLEKQSNLDFNVSHQGCFAVLAGCRTFANTLPPVSPHHQTCANNNTKLSIGVDVMKIEYSGGKNINEFFRLMDRNFSAIEWNNIKNQRNEKDMLRAFMRHWCLKESYVKNIGVGITIDLRKISFAVKSDYDKNSTAITDTTLAVDGIDMIDWTFEESLINDDHCVAVALHGHLPRDYQTPAFRILNFNELTEGSIPLLSVDEDYCKSIADKSYKNQN